MQVLTLQNGVTIQRNVEAINYRVHISQVESKIQLKKKKLNSKIEEGEEVEDLKDLEEYMYTIQESHLKNNNSAYYLQPLILQIYN